jgi:hypothetical protein
MGGQAGYSNTSLVKKLGIKLGLKIRLLTLLGSLASGVVAQRSGPARLAPNTQASITAVIDTTDWKNIRSYYKLADGRVVGEDSVYSFDATDDWESDGKIRFRDRVTDKVGFFDNNGKVVVPALYNEANRFYNGMAMVIKNAKRVGWHGQDCEKGDCEHLSWSGGNSMLIDAKNQILIDTLKIDDHAFINWYSLEIKDEPGDSTRHCSLKGVNGKWYVFLDYRKEFDNWFRVKFLAAATDVRKLREFAHDSLVSLLPEYDGWKRMSGEEFMQNHANQLKTRLQPIRDHQITTFSFIEGLNPYIHTGGSFDPYFECCGERNLARYPAFDVISNFMDKNGHLDYQEHYSFLRTNAGYKLIGVSWRNP